MERFNSANSPISGIIMLEIRFHGRGGQGTVVASILLAKAFFDAGYYVQTFPLFGVERRGAPVEAYLRLDKKKILIRSNIYTPDHIIVQDVKLLGSIDVTSGFKPGGTILINSKEIPDNLEPFPAFGWRLWMPPALPRRSSGNRLSEDSGSFQTSDRR